MARRLPFALALLCCAACGSTAAEAPKAAAPIKVSDRDTRPDPQPSPPTCEQRIERARAKHKPEAELAAYRAACDAHCAEGCRLMGGMYAEARGVAGDYDAAKKNYGAACELGNGDGCANLGDLALERTGSAGDAARHYTLGCELKSGLACAKLAYLHQVGRGAPLDPAKALELYEQGCSLDGPVGCSGAARMLELSPADDAHVKELDQRAFTLATARCDAGDPFYCGQLGAAYRDGHGVHKDVKRALELYQRACQSKVKDACEAMKAMGAR